MTCRRPTWYSSGCSPCWPAGATWAAFAVPDNVVQGFRGAAGPVGDFGSLHGTEKAPARTFELCTSYRLNPGLAEAWGRVARRIPVSAGAAGGHSSPGNRSRRAGCRARRRGRRTGHAARHRPRRRYPGSALRKSGDPGNPAALEVLLVDYSPIDEQRLVAQRLLEEHLMNGRARTSWPWCCVTAARCGPCPSTWREPVSAVNTPPAETPLREEPAVCPLLDLMQLALDRVSRTRCCSRNC